MIFLRQKVQQRRFFTFEGTLNKFGIRQITFIISAFMLLFFASCSDWNDHFDSSAIGSTSEVDVFEGDVVSYLSSVSSISKTFSLLKEQGMLDNMPSSNFYTVIVCEDDYYDESAITEDLASYASYLIADISLKPSVLVDGFGIETRLGKTIWVYQDGEGTKLEDCKIIKTVKADNGYVYYVDGMLPIRQSIYEFLQSLDDENYSIFKQLVTQYDTLWFDREQSTVIGIKQDGSTLYDSVIVTKNTLMDRYTEAGLASWNMRDEVYNSTMFIPSNDQITSAINNACDSIPVWLHREATSDDTLKFKKWIVQACFIDKKLNEEEVASNASMFASVGGYQEIIDETADKTTYESLDTIYWKPSVQVAKTGEKVSLSNGNAYFLDKFKIPNHIVIYRVKARFYELWNAMTETQKKQYFIWDEWEDPMVVNDAQSSFYSNTTSMGDWPDIQYNVLTAIPSSLAQEDSLTCSVEITGVALDSDDKVYECSLPAGEYYFRMGFVHSLTYSLSIYFRDIDDIENNNYPSVVTDMIMMATGSNYHFDRGGASDIKNYGGTYVIGYAENYDPAYYHEINENAYLYDTDGWPVGNGRITLKRSGGFRIKISSSDESIIWVTNGNTNRDKNNKTQLMIYHWCLRPTPNNY